MRTMSSVWFSVIVLLAVQEAFGDICDKNNNEVSCDDCIRCGGNWCNERGSVHCVFSAEDGWCPHEQERLLEIPQVNNPGDLITPIYAERTLFSDSPNTIDIHYTAKVNQKAQIEVVNSTQTLNILVREHDVKCAGTNCISTIWAKPKKNFCSPAGKPREFVHVKVNVGGLDETIVLKYHVPCACQCSQWVNKTSEYCSKNGDFSCGVCTCYKGWTGDDCSKPTEDNIKPSKGNFRPTKGGPSPVKGHGRPTESNFMPTDRNFMPTDRNFMPTDVNIRPTEIITPECPHKRGDVQCMNPINDLQCSGNGYCGPCDTCVCYKDREGSQYFDQENYCTDLCMVVSGCDFCLVNNTLGLCDGCVINNHFSLYVQKYNSSVTDERDDLNRKMWVTCNETVNDCRINYVAKRDEFGDIVVMIVGTCNDVIADAVAAGPKVSIILIVLALVACVAAVAGVMYWKHMTALPPVSPQDPGYQNIDAEDCVGENPLYRPPTSSFKNPTYGKW